MNKRIIMLMAAALALLSASGQMTFTGKGVEDNHDVIEITPEKSTGLDKIYVLYDTLGVEMTYHSTSGGRAVWKDFSFQEIPGVKWDGHATKLSHVKPNRGYIIEENGATAFCCWVVNYADYMMELNDMFFESSSTCDLLNIRVDGIAKKILYTTTPPSCRSMVLDRELELSYETLVWNGNEWEPDTVVETFESLDDGIEVAQPLCNTYFWISGDRFLKEWNMKETLQSRDELEAIAVNCVTTAVRLDRDDGDNEGEEGQGGEDGEDDEDEQEEQEGDLGGSAPIHILFTGYPTDSYVDGAVVFRVWEIARDIDFQDVIMQYNQDELDYIFDETGTFYVRYRVANATGSCEKPSTNVYTIAVSESYVPEQYKMPNTFSPYVKDGVNDKWKVTTKSIIEFHCWIYNRWGGLVYEYTDPNDGWDGTSHGKLVDTGVYYYVLTATGSDGFKYKRRGAITILGEPGGAIGVPTEGGVVGGD